MWRQQPEVGRFGPIFFFLKSAFKRLLSIFVLAPVCHYAAAQQEWNLNKIKDADYQFEVPGFYLANKAKYSSQQYPSTLFTHIAYHDNADLSIHQLSTNDYLKSPFNNYIMIRRDTSGPRGAVNADILLRGSTSNYGKDFAPIDNEEFVVLADNKGDGWDEAKLFNSLLKDSTQLLLCRITSKNKLVWHQVYGGSSAEYGVAIAQTPDGNLLVLAQTQSGDGLVQGYHGGKDIWLLKIRITDGTIIWQNTIGTNVDEIPKDMEILADGSILLAGTAQPSALFPSSYAGFNAFLMKMDATGKVQWTKTFGGDQYDDITAIVPDMDGGFLSIGNSASGNGDYPGNKGGMDVYIMHHNSMGDITWQKQYGGKNDEQAGDIAQGTCDSTIYASMTTEFASTIPSFSSYPAYCQNQGIKICMTNAGIQTYYFQDDARYYYGGDEYFNNNIITSIVANRQGGILALGNRHARWGGGHSVQAEGKVSRSYHTIEFGVPLRRVSVDTSLCPEQTYLGKSFSADTLYSDTLRIPYCNIDTLIIFHRIRVNADRFTQKDTTVCYGDKLNGQAVFSDFVQTDTVTVRSVCGTLYRITALKVAVVPPLDPALGADTTICKDATLLLIANSAGTTYKWQDGKTGSSYTVTGKGMYTVSITDASGCLSHDSIIVTQSDLFLEPVKDTIINYPASWTIHPNTNGTLNWKPDPSLSCTSCASSILSPASTTTYQLSAIKDGCSISESFSVTVNKGFYLYIPNAFSPNGDNTNDLFRVKTNATGSFSLAIYNRYGQLIFNSHEPGVGWDGTFHGLPQPAGAYTYVLQYKDMNGRNEIKKKSLLLVR